MPGGSSGAARGMHLIAGIDISRFGLKWSIYGFQCIKRLLGVAGRYLQKELLCRICQTPQGITKARPGHPEARGLAGSGGRSRRGRSVSGRAGRRRHRRRHTGLEGLGDRCPGRPGACRGGNDLALCRNRTSRGIGVRTLRGGEPHPATSWALPPSPVLESRSS